MKCDLCESVAVHHVTEVEGAKLVERHLCGACALGVVKWPPVGPGGIAVAKLSREMLTCARCGGETAVVVFGEEEPSMDRSVRRFKSRAALCAGCAGKEGVTYEPARVGEVAMVVRT